jgi:glycosyltransferase involved in cell wall biosynthesis
VTVIPPGVDLELFAPDAVKPAGHPGRRVRLLFVGGDFPRKGGPLLLQCMREGLAELCDLDIVTSAPVPTTPRTTVHAGLDPNDPRLRALYRSADIFVLPTHADCLAVVLGEAMAAGLPIVTTDVGAQPEAVQDGESGVVVRPGDVEALGRALRRLAQDPALRTRMGERGRQLAEQRFDARVNALRLCDVIESGVVRWQATRGRPGLRDPRDHP